MSGQEFACGTLLIPAKKLRVGYRKRNTFGRSETLRWYWVALAQPTQGRGAGENSYSASFQGKGLDFRATQGGASSDKSLRLGHL